MVQFAKDRFKTSNNVTITDGSLFTPVPDIGKFDVVFHRATILYCRERLAEYAIILNQLLKPKGSVIALEPDDHIDKVSLALRTLVRNLNGTNETQKKVYYSRIYFNF